MIDANYYSALPAGDRTGFLSREYRKLLLFNLNGYLRSIQDSFGLDITFIIEKYQHLDPAKRFSPAIYNYFSRLTNSSTKGEVPAIIDVLHQLNLLTNDEILDGEFRLTTILTEKWETEFVAKIRTEQIPSKSGETTLVLPIINPDLNPYINMYQDLKDQVNQLDPDFYRELEDYVTRVKLFNGRALKAATSSSVYGAIYMKLPPENDNAEAYFAEHIIHETSHLQLDKLLAFDKIVLNDESERYAAPIRIDPRPMFGIFHATFVLSRMVRLFQRIAKENPKKEYTDRLDVFRKQFDKGLETVEKNAVLTENGKKISQSFAKTAEI